MRKESTIYKENVMAEAIRELSPDLPTQVIADLLQINRATVTRIQGDPAFGVKNPLRLKNTGRKRDKGQPQEGCVDYNNLVFFFDGRY